MGYKKPLSRRTPWIFFLPFLVLCLSLDFPQGVPSAGAQGLTSPSTAPKSSSPAFQTLSPSITRKWPVPIPDKEVIPFFDGMVQTFALKNNSHRQLLLIDAMNRLLATLECSSRIGYYTAALETFLKAPSGNGDVSAEKQILAGLVLIQVGDYAGLLKAIQSDLGGLGMLQGEGPLLLNGRQREAMKDLPWVTPALIFALSLPPPAVHSLELARASCQENNQEYRKTHANWCRTLQAHPSMCAFVHQNVFPPPQDHQTPITDPKHFEERYNYAPLGTYLVHITLPPPKQTLLKPNERDLLFYPILSVDQVKKLLTFGYHLFHKRTAWAGKQITCLDTDYWEVRKACVEVAGRYLYDTSVQSALLDRLQKETNTHILQILVAHFLNDLYGMGLYHPEAFKKKSFPDDGSPLSVLEPIAPVRLGWPFSEVMTRFLDLGFSFKNAWAREALAPHKFGYLLRGYKDAAQVARTLVRWIDVQCRTKDPERCREEWIKNHRYSPSVQPNVPSEARVWAVKVLWWLGISKEVIGDSISASVDSALLQKVVPDVFYAHETAEVRAAAASSLRGLDPQAEQDWFDRLPRDEAWQVRKAICEQLLTRWPHEAIERVLNRLAEGFFKMTSAALVLKKLSNPVQVEDRPKTSNTGLDFQKRLETLTGREFTRYKVAAQRWKSFELTPQEEKILRDQRKREPNSEVHACLDRILNR